MSVEQVLEQAKSLSSTELEVLILELQKESRRHAGNSLNHLAEQTIHLESPIEVIGTSPSLREILDSHRKSA